MEPENLCYAVVQVVHNFGAAAVAGGSVVMLSSLWEVRRQRQIAQLVLAGWLTQALSGRDSALSASTIMASSRIFTGLHSRLLESRWAARCSGWR